MNQLPQTATDGLIRTGRNSPVEHPLAAHEALHTLAPRDPLGAELIKPWHTGTRQGLESAQTLIFDEVRIVIPETQ